MWETPHHRYRVSNHTGTHALDPVVGAALFGSGEAARVFATRLLPTLTGRT